MHDVCAARHPPADAVFTTRALQDLATRIQVADSLEQLLDSILEGIEEVFGFAQSMILLPGEQEGVLVTIASRGYAQSGVGSEARFGEGIAGMVAEARKPIRISGLMRGMLYALAVRKRAEELGLHPDDRRIPMPGLPHPESQLGMPLLVRGNLVGVLCIESEVPYRFHEEDKTAIELLGSYLAIAVQNILWRERADAVEPRRVALPPRRSLAETQQGDHHEVVFYCGDELIMLDGEYLVRSLPARIFWKLLRLWSEQGRTEFTNRELRLDKALNLPGGEAEAMPLIPSALNRAVRSDTVDIQSISERIAHVSALLDRLRLWVWRGGSREQARVTGRVRENPRGQAATAAAPVGLAIRYRARLRRYSFDAVRMKRLPRETAGVANAISSSELRPTTSNTGPARMTYVSPSSLIAKILPLYAQGEAVKPLASRATRCRP